MNTTLLVVLSDLIEVAFYQMEKIKYQSPILNGSWDSDSK